jgi:hypothetical protein
MWGELERGLERTGLEYFDVPPGSNHESVASVPRSEVVAKDGSVASFGSERMQVDLADSPDRIRIYVRATPLQDKRRAGPLP